MVILAAGRGASPNIIRYRVKGALKPTSKIGWSYDETQGFITNLDGTELNSVSEQTVRTENTSR